MDSYDKLTEELVKGNRRALSKAITLAESHRAEDRDNIGNLLSQFAGEEPESFRLAVSGPPGVGKSTFIDAFGERVARDHRLAVLTIDPSSPVSGGSILGDKTRMERLSSLPSVFVRPSPSGKGLGGTARNTADVIRLCEIAGYDFIILETVGVGQSETTAFQLTDHFLLLLNAGGGDELQGIKRGIMELADTFLFTKEDSIPSSIMKRSMGDLRTALHVLRPSFDIDRHLLSVAALNPSSLEKLSEKLLPVFDKAVGSQEWLDKRESQRLQRFTGLLEVALIDRIQSDPRFSKQLTLVKKKVKSGELTAHNAVYQLLESIWPLK